MTLSALHLRQGLLLATQPALCTEDGLVQRAQVEHMRKYLIDECAITLRRFNNAADAVNLNPRIREQLVSALFT